MDHVQVSVGEGVLWRGRRAGLNASVLCVVVGLSGPRRSLLPLGQVQVCVGDVIVVLDLNAVERSVLWRPLPLLHPAAPRLGASVSPQAPLSQP